MERQTAISTKPNKQTYLLIFYVYLVVKLISRSVAVRQTLHPYYQYNVIGEALTDGAESIDVICKQGYVCCECDNLNELI